VGRLSGCSEGPKASPSGVPVMWWTEVVETLALLEGDGSLEAGVLRVMADE
jgi:hypothetical protein